jgi:hypothetical protein
MTITISAVTARQIALALRQSAEKQSKEHMPDPLVENGYHLQPHDFTEWGLAEELDLAVVAATTKRAVRAGPAPIGHPGEWDARALELARSLSWRLEKTRPEQRVSTMQLSILDGIRYGAEYGFSNPMGRIVHATGTIGVHWSNPDKVRLLPEGTNVYIKTGYQEPSAS